MWDENMVVLDVSDFYANPFNGDVTPLDLTNAMQLVRSPVDVICNSTSDKKIKCHKQPGIE